MYRRFEQSTDRVLGYHVSGTIAKADVDSMQQEIKEAIERHGKVRILCEIGDLNVPEPSAMWEDLKFAPHYVKDVERFALVGDKAWHKWLSSLSDRLTHAETRYFTSAELGDAWAWITAE
jgi:hypothetical protein